MTDDSCLCSEKFPDIRPYGEILKVMYNKVHELMTISFKNSRNYSKVRRT